MTIPLSIPSIRYAVELCEEKPGYHFGIIIADDTLVESVFDTCLDFVDWAQYNHIHTATRTDNATIAFKNGSYIQILRPSDTRRCLLWHACLTDPKLDKKAAHKASAKYLRLTYK
jgi:hypothetical protein